MGTACRSHLIQGCIAPAFPEAAETVRCRPKWPTVLLWYSYKAGAWVCVPGMAFESHGSMEAIQRRAMQIIFADNDYTMSLIRARMDTLESRRAVLTERFFRRIVLHEASCLHYLLPDKRDSSVTDRLRHAKTFHSIQARTNKFRNSFLPFCLEHFD